MSFQYYYHLNHSDVVHHSVAPYTYEQTLYLSGRGRHLFFPIVTFAMMRQYASSEELRPYGPNGETFYVEKDTWLPCPWCRSWNSTESAYVHQSTSGPSAFTRQWCNRECLTRWEMHGRYRRYSKVNTLPTERSIPPTWVLLQWKRVVRDEEGKNLEHDVLHLPNDAILLIGEFLQGTIITPKYHWSGWSTNPHIPNGIHYIVVRGMCPEWVYWRMPSVVIEGYCYPSWSALMQRVFDLGGWSHIWKPCPDFGRTYPRDPKKTWTPLVHVELDPAKKTDIYVLNASGIEGSCAVRQPNPKCSFPFFPR